MLCDVKARQVTFNNNQQERVLCSCVYCLHLNGSAGESERLWILKSSTGPLIQEAADCLSVYARQQVGNSCMSEWSYTEDVLFKVKSLKEGEGASSPNKNLQHETNKRTKLQSSVIYGLKFLQFLMILTQLKTITDPSKQ